MKRTMLKLVWIFVCAALLIGSVSAAGADDGQTVVSSTRIDLEDGAYVIEEITQSTAQNQP